METEIGANESVSTVVIRAASAVDGREPDSLQPLTDVVDPDALNALFEPRCNDVLRGGGRLTFTYSGCRITIDDGEFLTIEPIGTTGRPSAGADGTAEAQRGRSQGETHQRGRPDLGVQRAATGSTPESRVCFVCQQPIQRENPQRALGELVHDSCRAELRCGISFETWPER